MAALIPVHFLYIHKERDTPLDTEFDALCHAIPRVGEFIRPNAGSPVVVVHSVIYKPAHDPELGGMVMSPTVVLRRPFAEELEAMRSIDPPAF